MGGAAISFPFLLLTDNVGEKFRYGNPSGLSYGFVSGIATGITSAFLIHSYRENRRGFPLFRLYSTSMWLAATAESLALGTLAYTTELRPGQSAIIASAGIWGSGLGMSSSSMRMKERDRFTEPVRAWSAMGGHVAALAGATTAVYAFDYSPSQLQVLLMNSGYSAGLLSAFYFTGNSAKAGPGYVAMASTIGSLIGLGAGATFAHLFFEQDRKDLRDPKRLEKASALDSLTLSVAPSMNAEKASDLSIMASVQF